mgnify:FL=1
MEFLTYIEGWTILFNDVLLQMDMHYYHWRATHILNFTLCDMFDNSLDCMNDDQFRF